MKQIVKTTLAVIALATLTSEIAVAQQQVAKNRRERKTTRTSTVPPTWTS